MFSFIIKLLLSVELDLWAQFSHELVLTRQGESPSTLLFVRSGIVRVMRTETLEEAYHHVICDERPQMTFADAATLASRKVKEAMSAAQMRRLKDIAIERSLFISFLFNWPSQ
jgi:hypothetical protein